MGARVPKGGDGGRLRTGCAAKGETARWGIGYGDGCLRVGSAPRDVRPWNLLEEPDLFRAQPGPVLVQQPARRGVGVEAIVKVPALMSGQPANHRLLEIGVMIVGEKTADLIRSGPRPTAGSPSSEEPFPPAAANNCGGRNLLEPTSADRPLFWSFFFEPPTRARTVQHPARKRTAKQTVETPAQSSESAEINLIGQTLMTSALFFKIGQ